MFKIVPCADSYVSNQNIQLVTYSWWRLRNKEDSWLITEQRKQDGMGRNLLPGQSCLSMRPDKVNVFLKVFQFFRLSEREKFLIWNEVCVYLRMYCKCLYVDWWRFSQQLHNKMRTQTAVISATSSWCSYPLIASFSTRVIFLGEVPQVVIVVEVEELYQLLIWKEATHLFSHFLFQLYINWSVN